MGSLQGTWPDVNFEVKRVNRTAWCRACSGLRSPSKEDRHSMTNCPPTRGSKESMGGKNGLPQPLSYSGAQPEPVFTYSSASTLLTNHTQSLVVIQ